MHQYLLEVYAMSAEGQIIDRANPTIKEYYDVPIKVVDSYNRYNNATITPEAGEPYKAYTVLIKTAKFVDVSISQFLAMYKPQ